jgi:hypothetical protein
MCCSSRASATTRARSAPATRAVSKVDAQVWLNPFYWADHGVFTDYRRWNGTPRNLVKEKLGMSAECLCGSHAEPGELERIGWVCPATHARILDLQRRVREAGFAWGWEDPGPPTSWKGKKRRKARKAAGYGIYVPDAEADYRPMCHNCDKIHMLRVGGSCATKELLFA